MEETPMCFDLPGNRIVNKKKEKNILFKTTGHEKTNFPVVLSYLADSNKLPPMIIFKHKTLPKTAVFPSGELVHAHEKGWMNETRVIDWMKNMWNKRPGAVFKKCFILNNKNNTCCHPRGFDISSSTP